MSGTEREAEEPGDRQQQPLALGWLVFAVVLLSPAFSIIAVLMARGLGLTDSSNHGLVGMIVALLMVGITVPRTAGQLGLVVAIVTVGGILAILVALAFEFLGWGLWGSLLGGAIAASVGSGVIILSYRRLGVELRRPPKNGQA